MNNAAAVKTYKALRGYYGIPDADGYFKTFYNILKITQVSFSSRFDDAGKKSGKAIRLSDAIDYLLKLLADVQAGNKKLMVIGNGGSAGIAIHALADYANAGGFKTTDFYGPSLLTCLANDYGYENVFGKSVEMFSEPGDALFAISSSGQSPNIIAAAEAAKVRGCMVVTFSGFDKDNPLRKIGNMNFYVPSPHYGFVELAHQTIIHCILDLFVRNKLYEEERELLG